MARYGITHVIDTPACDESVIRGRGGRGPITDDAELIAYAEEATNNYFHAGHCRNFRTFPFIGYDIERKFTYKELVRIHELQEIENEKYNDLYGWDKFKGKPLTEEVIIRFMDRHIAQQEKQYGKDSFWHKQAIEIKEQRLKEWRNGQVILVDDGSDAYNDRGLYSDGTVREYPWGD